MALPDEVKAFQTLVLEKTESLLADAGRLERLGQQLGQSHRCWPSRVSGFVIGGLLLYVLFMHSTFSTERDTLWPNWQQQAREELGRHRAVLSQWETEVQALLRTELTVVREEVGGWQLTLDQLRADSEVLSHYTCR